MGVVNIPTFVCGVASAPPISLTSSSRRSFKLVPLFVYGATVTPKSLPTKSVSAPRIAVSNSLIAATNVVLSFVSNEAKLPEVPYKSTSCSSTASIKLFAVIDGCAEGLLVDPKSSTTNAVLPPLIAVSNSLIDVTTSVLSFVSNRVISPISSCNSKIASTALPKNTLYSSPATPGELNSII